MDGVKVIFLPGAPTMWNGQRGLLGTTDDRVEVHGPIDTARLLLARLRNGHPIELRTTMIGSYAPHKVRWTRSTSAAFYTYENVPRQGKPPFQQTLVFPCYQVTEVTVHRIDHEFAEERRP